ncbi:unnamed protein product [Protopolystoma xenopodis]|uniref:Uncharacterized protein n=1 Tax=Protopolystoma xenopodis TaxID=117903 RepID=A0A3S5CN72_9PLAT|nr:unnamed protein product [Protopolystoma xenopodis]
MTDKPTEQPTEQPTDQPSDMPTDQKTGQASDKQEDQRTEQPIVHTFYHPTLTLMSLNLAGLKFPSPPYSADRHLDCSSDRVLSGPFTCLFCRLSRSSATPVQVHTQAGMGASADSHENRHPPSEKRKHTLYHKPALGEPGRPKWMYLPTTGDQRPAILQ